MPPMNCERAVCGLRMRPQPRTRRAGAGTRTSPVSASTRTSANWAPKEWRGDSRRRRVLGGRGVDAERAVGAGPPVLREQGLDGRDDRRRHEAVPIEPPATIAGGSALSPISTRTRSSGTSSASAAICVSTVRAPVPMSAAAMRTVKLPSSVERGRSPSTARGGPGRSRRRRPVPTSQRPSRRAPGPGRGASQPKRSAPSRRQSTRCRRARTGCPLSGSTSGSLRTRSSIGSMPSAMRELVHRGLEREHRRASRRARASSDGVGTSSATSRWRRAAGRRGVHACGSRRPSARRTPGRRGLLGRRRGRSR